MTGFGESIYSLDEMLERLAVLRADETAEAAARAATPRPPRRKTGTGHIPNSATRRQISRGVRAANARRALATEPDMSALKRARIEAGLTQAEASARCGVARRTFQAIEAGRPARREAARRIHETFGVRVEVAR